MAPSSKSWNDFSPTQWCIHHFNSSVWRGEKTIELELRIWRECTSCKGFKMIVMTFWRKAWKNFLQTHNFKNCGCWLQLPVFRKKLLSLNFEDGGSKLCVTAAKCLLWLSRGSLELTFFFSIRMWREKTLCEGLEMFVMSLSSKPWTFFAHIGCFIIYVAGGTIELEIRMWILEGVDFVGRLRNVCYVVIEEPLKQLFFFTHIGSFIYIVLKLLQLCAWGEKT